MSSCYNKVGDKMNSKLRKISVFGICLTFFALFAFITYLTPLAGDDWGYAINGLKNNPLISAYNFYFTWSGRFFSELWGFIVAPNKWLWNILNPLLFTGIIYFMYRIISPKKNPISTLLLIIFLVLSVKDFVRMETYTWIMGTTYVVPLFLFLLYTYLLKLMVFDGDKNILIYIGSCLINIYIPLCMENIAVGLILANLLVLIYVYFTNKNDLKKFSLFLAISIVGFVILRMSPGATYRLQNEHAAWLEMNIFEQISANWNTFLTYTFLDNKYLICILSLVLIGFTYANNYKYKKYPKASFILIGVFILGFLQSIAANIYSKLPLQFLRYLFDITLPETTIVITLLFLGYIFSIIWVLSTMMDDYKKWTCIFLVLVGGTCNIAMLLSPIFGPRSSIYTIFILSLVASYLYEELMNNRLLNKIVFIALVILNLIWSKNYISKYKLVDSIQKERLQKIEYYQDHPEEREAWLPRMPIMSVHSADIEEWDIYHQDVFKEYYGLNPEMKVIFFWKENY